MHDIYNKAVIFVNRSDEEEVLKLLKEKEIEAAPQRFYSDYYYQIEAESHLMSFIDIIDEEVREKIENDYGRYVEILADLFSAEDYVEQDQTRQEITQNFLENL